MKTIRLSVAACTLLGAALTLPTLAAPADAVSLGIEGRSNAAPWIAAAGRFVVVSWGASTEGRGDVYVAVSRDAGATFGAPVRVNQVAGEARLGGELPPRVAIGSVADRDPEIVVLWNARGQTTEIKIARSRDGGRTFSSATVLQSSGAPGDRGWHAVAVDASGAAHTIWLDHRALAARKTGAGAHEHGKMAEYDGAAMAQLSGLYYARVGSATESAAATTTMEGELAKGVCYCCKTAMAVTGDGSLYAAWRHVYPGNLRDIALTRSRDGGRTFSEPVRVSEDQWQLNGCPDDGPALAVDAADTIHIVWLTVIGGATPQGALFYSTTRDGQTFTPRARIPTLGSPKPSHPQIAIDSKGMVVIAWDEVIEGKRIALVRRVAGAAPMQLGAPQSGMYPVMANTSEGLVAAWTAGAPGSSIIKVQNLR
jgi:hypothetical protein